MKKDRSLFDESSHEEEEHENTKQSNKKMVSMNVDKDVWFPNFMDLILFAHIKMNFISYLNKLFHI